MIKAIVSLMLALGFAGAAYAQCKTHSYMINGKFVTCTTCCFNGHCTTTCT